MELLGVRDMMVCQHNRQFIDAVVFFWGLWKDEGGWFMRNDEVMV